MQTKPAFDEKRSRLPGDNYVAKRIRFRNGERHSVVSRPGGLPVHEVTVYLAKYRTRGRSANTIHSVCTALALMYRVFDKAGIDILQRLSEGLFPTVPELNRLAEAAQYRVSNLFEETEGETGSCKVVDIRRIRMRRKATIKVIKPVDVGTQANRIRYMADYLDFLGTYFSASLPKDRRKEMQLERDHALRAFRANVPKVSKRPKLDARVGLSKEEQDQVLQAVAPGSLNNPWKRGFVQLRNWLIVIILLATGMRRGELLGMKIGDLGQSQPKLRVLRRADDIEDQRPIQPNSKTNERELALRPNIMRAVWGYINHERRSIKAARRHPFLIVSDDGQPLSLKSVDKLFGQLREACPGLPVRLTSHVMRHTWNERFSEQAELLGLDAPVEEKARNEQQGWSDNSKMAVTYTRRYTAKKGREIALRLQEALDEKIS